MRRKQRPSDPKTKFDVFNRLRGFHRTRLADQNVGDVGLVVEPGDGSFNTYDCSTLVLQALPKGTKADREKPISIFWHIHPRVFSRASRVEEEKKVGNPEKIAWWHTVLSVTGSLRGDASFSMPPEDVVGNMLNYIEGHKPSDARVRATLIPGANTQDSKHPEHQVAMDAIKQTKEVLQGFKNKGRIHNIRTRGFSPHAKTKGALHVWVDPNGTIHRITPKKT